LNKKSETDLLINKAKDLKIIDTLGEDYFHLYIEEYDVYLEGFIDKDISIYKCKGKKGKHIWVCAVNNSDIFEIKKTDDILEISSVIEYKSYGFVYIINSPKMGFKIGSTRSIHNREAIFNVKLPFKWDFHKIYLCEKQHIIETKALHPLFESKRLEGEWFNLNKEDLDMIDHFMKLNCP
jgi:hypothetical protein